MLFYSNRFKKVSFSQCGEDCIVDHMFKLRGIIKPSFIDIGAYHPFSFSNTAKFYLQGSRGVNIEPNPTQYKYFNFFRRKDINLNIGIGAQEGMLTYYHMNEPTMNTFDYNSVNELTKNHGLKIEKESQIRIEGLQSVIRNYCSNVFPDFLSLDVEGLDELILQQIDYDRNWPKIICVETTKFTHDATGEKNDIIIDFLKDKGYTLFADTQINSIFVKKEFWLNK